MTEDKRASIPIEDVNPCDYYGIILTELMLGIQAGESYTETHSIITRGEMGFSVKWAMFESGLLLIHLMPDLFVTESQRLRIAEAVVRANYGIPIGGFRLDMDCGALQFVTTYPMFRTLEPRELENLFLRSMHWALRFLPPIRRLLAEADLSPASVIAAEWEKPRGEAQPCS
ncbi:MAG: hypothetical protein V2A79_00845 [Planctomycetota bacterium]